MENDLGISLERLSLSSQPFKLSLVTPFEPKKSKYFSWTTNKVQIFFLNNQQKTQHHEPKIAKTAPYWEIDWIMLIKNDEVLTNCGWRSFLFGGRDKAFSK